ncbi:MAG: tripartite tricarboxylate transporter substrate binding protein [Burkholderiales bacterium]|nr:tripartite tricarboxylate transporter substrate binding protein [Burkholderiales bacterium]
MAALRMACKSLRWGLTLLAWACVAPWAQAALLDRHVGADAPFPNRPIRLVVTFPPGGGTDVLARILGAQLGEVWREQVVIDNRPGASGNIGAEIVARAAPDGYTLLMVNSTFAMNAGLYSKLPFDSLEDFAAVARVASTSGIVAAHPSLEVRTMSELLAAARSRGGKLAYSSCGSGTPQHLSGELLKYLAKVEMIHVPYKGCAPALADGLSGQVPVIFNTVPNVMPHARAGRLRALAVTSGKRFPLEPELPTVAEAGLKGYDVDQWFAVLGPAGIPEPVLATLNREIVRIVNAPALREKLVAQHFVPAPSTPQALAALVREDVARWSKLIKQVGIRVD